jgi:hypothetical protein
MGQPGKGDEDYENYVEPPPDPEEVIEDEVRKVNPFRVIRRGDDTVDGEDDIVFADFSPKVLPADTPEEVVPVPKDSSAVEPASFSESTQTSEPKKKASPASASAGAGKRSQSAASKQGSSSSPKTG